MLRGRVSPGSTCLCNSRQDSRHETKTDAAGAFRVSGVTAGEYQISFESANYNTGADSARLRIVVAPNQTAQVAVALDPWASLSGQVVDADGSPLAGAKIFLRDHLGQTPGGVHSVPWVLLSGSIRSRRWGSHFHPGTLQRLITLGSTVKVEENGIASVELRMNAWPE